MLEPLSASFSFWGISHHCEDEPLASPSPPRVAGSHLSMRNSLEKHTEGNTLALRCMSQVEAIASKAV